MKIFMSFLLVLVSLVSYAIVSTRFGLFQRYPVVHLLFAAIGIALLVRFTAQNFTAWRLLATVFSVALLGFFSWWIFFYSTYENAAKTIRAGEQISNTLSGIVLKTADGADFNVGEEISKQPLTLLVFNRGVW